ncbi:hypothetical protein [Actinocorallia libanotica]|uniref:Secreted protein n=1 Tax=Actinocorallia libanotica TaxID=46162 RepID=A0ABN1Q1H3_9ACTN
MTVDQIVQHIKELGALAAALAAIGGVLWWAVGKPFRNFLQREIVANLVSIKDATEESTQVAKAVQHELHAHVTDPDAHGGRV